MATRNINKTRLKALKKKSYASKKAVYDLDRTMSNINRRLFPQQAKQPEKKKTAKPVDYSGKIAELEKKLAASQQDSSASANKREKDIQKSLSKLRNALTGQMQNLGQSTMQNDKALQEAIRKAEERRGQSQSTEEKKENVDEDTTQRDAYGPHNNYGRALEQVTEAATNAAEKPEKTTAAKNIAAKIGEYIGVGSHKYKVTNTFGLRTGKNTVPGREGQHSRGIDVVGTDAQGRNTNIPIAIADGVIKNITLQGSGEAYDPTSGEPSGGYIMDVQLPNGKIMRYMHLGKDVMREKDRLIGKPIKRGEVLHTGDNSKGSGSQTAPHTKISITSVDKEGNYLLDYDKEENDPTPYLFGKA